MAPPAPIKPQPSKATVQLSVASQFTGPIPPPELLRGYSEILPGLPERIVSMAEQEAIHRRQIETKELQANIDFGHKQFAEARLGQLCALLIGSTAIFAGVYTAVHGHEIAGSIFGGTGVVGLVSVFIIGRRTQK
jgi:uncharacterized membrane protein